MQIILADSLVHATLDTLATVLLVLTMTSVQTGQTIEIQTPLVLTMPDHSNVLVIQATAVTV